MSTLRRQLIDTCRRMNALGLNQGTSGNASARLAEGMLITPSGVDYDAMRANQIVKLDKNGRPTGSLKPSSEWRIHFDIMRARTDAGAILHCHAPFSTSLACLRIGIPAFHYMVAVAGGHDIRCAGYATFGTQALSDRTLAALEGRKACLMANHGMIALGADLAGALKLAVEVETLARQYWQALQVGKPKLLGAREMDRVLAKFADYGKQPTTRRPAPQARKTR